VPHPPPSPEARPAPDPRRSEPAVRSSHLKEDVAALAALGPAVRARVLARVRPDTLAAIEEGTRVSWSAIALNVELAEAVFAEAGETGARTWGKASFLASLDTFFKPLLLGIVKLFDLRPSTVMRFTPQAWPAVYRNCGELTVRADGDTRARILARSFPRALRTEPFLHAVAGTIEGGLEICKHDIEVQWELGGEQPDDVTYLITWKAR